MAVSPLTNNVDVVSFSITAGGQEISAGFEVIGITVDLQINKIATAEIVILDGSTSEQTFDIAGGDTFKPGVEIEIKLGYHSKNTSVFKGVVVKETIQVHDGSASRLVVTCKDKALASTITRKNALFANQTDSAIIQTVLGDYSLAGDVTSTSATLKEVVQFYCTDWDFVNSRAEVNGMVVITDGGKVNVAKPGVSDSPAIKVQFGYDMIEFDCELDSTFQYSGVESDAWDMSSQSVINSQASEPSVNDQGDLSGSTLAGVLSAGTNKLGSSVPITQDSLTAWADATLLKSRLSRFRGTVSFQGNASTKINSTIELAGLSARFNGNAYVSGIVHRVEDGIWTTEARIGMSNNWFADENDVSAPKAAGLLPGVSGLQTGTVKKIYEDPDNEFRVQVDIPILGADGDGVWARLSTFYNGSGVGAFFMPEVNDEVILGFMNDDPRFPVILGSLYSSSISPPQTPDENNTIKTLVTMSKLTLQFDDENKVITVETPGGNSITLSDQDKGITIKDQNGNKAVFNDSGIDIESQSSMTLKAQEKVSIQAPQISISGEEQISGSGGTISFTGDESVSVSSSGECSISGAGETSISGSMVMIN